MNTQWDDGENWPATYVVRLLAFAAQAFYDNDGVHIYIVLWKNYYYVLLKNCLIFQWLDMMFHFGCFTRRRGIKMRIFVLQVIRTKAPQNDVEIKQRDRHIELSWRWADKIFGCKYN